MSKNLLSENMLRFGTKNLSTRQEQELIVKSIMETINQHGLHGDVRRRLMVEQAPAIPKRDDAKQRSLEKTYAGAAEDKFGVNGSIGHTAGKPATIAKKGATYVTNYTHGASMSGFGDRTAATSYMVIPKGTKFITDPVTNCAYAVVQKGVAWKNEFPETNAKGEQNGKHTMLDNNANGTLIASLKTTPVTVSFNYSSEALTDEQDRSFRINGTLFQTLRDNLGADGRTRG